MQKNIKDEIQKLLLIYREHRKSSVEEILSEEVFSSGRIHSSDLLEFCCLINCVGMSLSFLMHCVRILYHPYTYITMNRRQKSEIII